MATELEGNETLQNFIALLCDLNHQAAELLKTGNTEILSDMNDTVEKMYEIQHNGTEDALAGVGHLDKAAAYLFFEKQHPIQQMVHKMKYSGQPLVGYQLGKQAAREFICTDFFDGIDYLVPVPLAKKRLRQRGYNQSTEIAKGVSAISGIPVLDNVVRRNVFEGSQTNKGRWERNENVANVFALTDPSAISNRHLLLIDDVVTTGATVIACAQQLATAPNVKVSVLALGFAKS